MKKLLAVLLATFATSSIFAGMGAVLSVGSVLSVGLEVDVDGTLYQTTNHAMTIQNMRSGFHNVAVYLVESYEKKLIYDKEIELKDGVHFDITINRFGTAMMDERRLEPVDSYMDIQPMSDYDFQQAKKAIRDEWFDEGREVIARQIIDLNFLTTKQVKEILNFFTFDKKRLSIAKYAYAKCVDKQNYYQVNSVLTYSSSKTELAEYINDFFN